MNLFARFAALKKQVGGNREKRRFEFTMGRTPEEQADITPPSPAIRRILSQIHFALQLSKRLGGRYDSEIDAALNLLENCMASEGVLTNSAYVKAEASLLPMQCDAKQYEVLYVAHAHIDMNWMWDFRRRSPSRCPHSAQCST